MVNKKLVEHLIKIIMEDQYNLYARWHSGEITDEEYAMLKEKGILEDLEHIRSTTDRWKIPKYNSEAGFDKFKTKHIRPKNNVRKINLYWIGAIAACFALVFFITKTLSLSTGQQLYASNGTTEAIEFADGTAIVINDGSSIKYDQDNWINERKIELIGEAVFQVSKGKPFVVNTQRGTVEVLGTQFNVRSRGGNLYVECYEGSVRVSANDQTTILTAQQSVNVISGKMNEKDVISHSHPLWDRGTSKFYEEDLMSVFDELEYQFDVNIKASNFDRKFSGAFSHDDLDTALRNICKPLGLNYKIQKDQKTVLIE